MRPITIRRAWPALLAAVVAAATAVVTPAQTTGPATTAPASAPAALAVPMPPVQSYLDRGDTAAAERAMSAQLLATPGDDQARFSLGTVQFLQAVEHLGQGMYRSGLRHTAELHIPIPVNPNPEVVTYAQQREIARRLIDDVTAAEATLAMVKSTDVKLPLRIGTVRLDLTGVRHPPGPDTELWRVLQGLWHNPDLNAANAARFYVTLDAGDVQWLRGYCHLIAALGNMALAYDEGELFDRTGQLFFERTESAKYPFLTRGRKVYEAEGMDLADVVAFVHLVHLRPAEPLRLLEARRHLKAMAQCSRASWKLILAETDDDHEWIPSPRQHTVLPHVEVTQPMVDGWLAFLDQFDDILDGKLLIPFWRGDGKQGVNLAKLFFTDPQPFDLVLWAQGTGVAPALETGPLATGDVYKNLDRVFGGDVFSFGAWFN